MFVFIPIIPEMLERLQVDLQISEGQNEEVDLALNDQVNEAYTLLYALANGVSPLIGAFLHSEVGARKACDYVAYFNIGFGIISFIFNCGFFVFREDREFKSKLAALQAIGEIGQGDGTSRVISIAHVPNKSSYIKRPQRGNFGNTVSISNVYADKVTFYKASKSIYNRKMGAKSVFGLE